MKPLVTVAIPTFNRLGLLRRTIESVLVQSYENLEIVISDNASSDGTNEYLKTITDTRVKAYFNEQNFGMVANWDRCLAEASGDYFILMSDDDAFSDMHAIQKLVSGFLTVSSDDVGAVFSDVKIERPDKNINENTFSDKNSYNSVELIIDFFSSKVAIFPCATLLRTEDIRDIGGYSSFGAKLAVDACALIIVALKYNKICRIGEPLVIYRFHPSLSSSSVEVLSEDLSVMQKIVEKHRDKISINDYKKIKNIMSSAWTRIPIGFMLRRYREDKNYNIISILFDLIKYKRVFTFDNAVTLARRVARKKEI